MFNTVQHETIADTDQWENEIVHNKNSNEKTDLKRKKCDGMPPIIEFNVLSKL